MLLALLDNASALKAWTMKCQREASRAAQPSMRPQQTPAWMQPAVVRGAPVFSHYSNAKNDLKPEQTEPAAVCCIAALKIRTSPFATVNGRAP